jgi:hypothetical protein
LFYGMWFFLKSLSKVFYFFLQLKKLVNKKHFLVKEKFSLMSRKIFLFLFWAENTF